MSTAGYFNTWFGPHIVQQPPHVKTAARSALDVKGRIPNAVRELCAFELYDDKTPPGECIAQNGALSVWRGGVPSVRAIFYLDRDPIVKVMRPYGGLPQPRVLVTVHKNDQPHRDSINAICSKLDVCFYCYSRKPNKDSLQELHAIFVNERQLRATQIDESDYIFAEKY